MGGEKALFEINPKSTLREILQTFQKDLEDAGDHDSELGNGDGDDYALDFVYPNIARFMSFLEEIKPALRTKLLKCSNKENQIKCIGERN